MDLTPETVEAIKTFVLKTDDISKKIYRIVKPSFGCPGTAEAKFMDVLMQYYEGTPNQDTMDFINIVIDDWGAKDASECRVKNQTSATMALWPGWHLKLFGCGKRKLTNSEWRQRWTCAGNACGWDGASISNFIALKNSPIWKHLGDGAGGYGDTYGLSYPPFVIGTAMDWEEASTDECKRAGLVIKKASWPLTPVELDIREAVRKYGMPSLDDLIASH
jgi:hypothetical protein